MKLLKLLSLVVLVSCVDMSVDNPARYELKKKDFKTSSFSMKNSKGKKVYFSKSHVGSKSYPFNVVFSAEKAQADFYNASGKFSFKNVQSLKPYQNKIGDLVYRLRSYAKESGQGFGFIAEATRVCQRDSQGWILRGREDNCYWVDDHYTVEKEVCLLRRKYDENGDIVPVYGVRVTQKKGRYAMFNYRLRFFRGTTATHYTGVFIDSKSAFVQEVSKPIFKYQGICSAKLSAYDQRLLDQSQGQNRQATVRDYWNRR